MLKRHNFPENCSHFFRFQQPVSMSTMAQSASSIRFRSIRLLQDEPLGMGAYSQVCKAMLGKIPCVAKFLHPILKDPSLPNPNDAICRVKDVSFPAGWFNIQVPEAELHHNHHSFIPCTHPILSIAMYRLKDTDTERPSAKEICKCVSALRYSPVQPEP